MIYHIARRDAWEAASIQGEYCAPSLINEGFIHCSTREQVVAVANAAFLGQKRLVLLCIGPDKLSAELRWERPAHPTPEAADVLSDESLFPHVYGTLNLDAVVAVRHLLETATGFVLPADLP